ncbi:MAG TPA: DUF2058 domain-containing protein [Gammaproteobacteria bacterium]|nr:DUF2058 domain-containing protein [Gammaproteobacteria bacterium]
MGNSFQDQFLKAGLVNEKQVKKSKKAKYIKTKQAGKKKVEKVVDENRLHVQKKLKEQAEKDRQLNLERQKEANLKAISAQIKQLIEVHHQADMVGETAYNFTDGTLIKKIYVSDIAVKQIANGRLAIVKWDDQYKIVPKIVAEKISERDEKYVIHLETTSKSINDENDPYADYQIPDDLMW